MSEEQQLGLDDQEREEILEEIDELVANNRLPSVESARKLHSKKSGMGFPLLINLFAIAAVLFTFYFSNRLFDQKQQTLNLENAAYQSAEGKLLAELKKESAAQLEKKEQEIDVIQNELAELDRQSRQLVETMDQQIADREAELRLALEAELNEERLKLKSQGKTETAIESELAEIEELRKAEFETELASFRSAAETAIAAKEKELALARQFNEEMLAEASSEKERIQNETKKRETELTAQFEAEKASLTEDAEAAQAELERLTANQTRESLIIDQINGSYESIFTSIDAGNYEQASLQIDALKQLINDPGIALLKTVSDRSTNDQNIIRILQQKIGEQSYNKDNDTKSLAAAADLLLSAQEIAELGLEAYSEGRIEDASDHFTRSLEKIPFIQQAWTILEQISTAAETEQLSGYIDKAVEFAEKGLQSEAIEQFSLAAGSVSTDIQKLLTQALAEIITSSEKLQKAEISERELRLASFQEQNTALRQQMEQKLTEADTAYNKLLNEKNLENERLTRMIGERDQENFRINSEKEKTTASLNEAENEIASIRIQLDKDNKLSASEIAQLREELVEADRKYQELNSKLMEEKIIAENRSKASETTGYNSGQKQGRADAFSDIIEITSYLSGSSNINKDTESRITELISSDPAYGEAVKKIQELAMTGLSESSAEILPVKQTILIGSISFASGNEIVIEPLSDEPIEPGEVITIYRKERGRNEYYITSAIVSSATGNKITALTDSEGTPQARSMDLVYITK